ncbi:hypothetical protein BV898_04347 [Hypsibius exemplaris]|uniref:PSI domain-containing protein n=1 Tax=Hypsibius exemplaris TaxID=2072580 RepID=A0A1W0X2V0_HYPEX|nr:hypothetical protein BV898_04347 [Hypsibius exemplaris]
MELSGNFFGVVLLCQLMLLAQLAQCQQVTEGSTAPTPTTMNSTIPTTTMTPDQICQAQTTCEDCVKVSGAKCYFCNSIKGNSNSTTGCRLYPAAQVFPNSEQCALSDARWGVCWVNFEAVIISMSVIGGILILATGCTLYRCCCRNSGGKDNGSEIRWARETTERQARHADRRAEREAKMTSIRQKYGLNQDTASYNRMNEGN